MSKRAVVIGGAGFLGRRLVALIAGDADRHPQWPSYEHVHVFDRAHFEESAELAAARARSGVGLSSDVGDVCSPSAVRDAVRGAHTVFHLASLVDVGLRRNPKIQATNVEGTKNVVLACQEAAVPFLVYTSSEDVVLGESPIVNGDESIPYPSRIIHDYVRTKVEAERLVRAADRHGSLRTCAIRPVHIYGPDDPHAIKTSLQAFGRGTVPFLLGDGRARFDVVYVDNVAHAHLLAAGKLHEPATRDRVGGEAFFVGEGNAPNFFDWLRPYAESKNIDLPRFRLPFAGVAIVARIMELVHRLTGRDVPIHRFHLFAICQDFFFSNAKAERELGYRPLVPPDEGLKRTLAWVRELAIDA
jgi:sterol-4alpha-carboxylate 3-dehydrogenase (decarboxylating)